MRWRSAGWWVIAIACGGEESHLAPTPTLATILVTSSIEGFPLDPDGYTLNLDGSAASAMRVNDTIVFSNLTGGAHLLELSDISAQCIVRGSNPRTVAAPAGETVRTDFALLCGEPGTGRLIVKTFTYGERPKSYFVQVDGGPSSDIGPEDVVTLYSVPGGLNTVTLRRVPSFCSVTASNPRVLLVPGGGSKITLFKVRCPE